MTAGHIKRLRERELQISLEDEIFRGRLSTELPKPPISRDWCEYWSKEKEGAYYFCDWLGEAPCGGYTPIVAQDAVPDTGASTGSSGERIAAERVLEKVGAGAPPEQAAEPSGPAFGINEPPSVLIGSAMSIVSKLTPTTAGHVLQHALERDDGLQLRLSQNAFFQTCLIFGGPGAGKTNLFKQMVRGVLEHHTRPGCLLLDPKGVLQGLLKSDGEGAGSDPIVISSGGGTRCNILRGSLRPSQVGRLLAEVSLAEAGDINGGWAPIVRDIMESAAVVMDAYHRTYEKRTSAYIALTAKQLLRGFLRKARFPSAKGGVYWEYPALAFAIQIPRLPNTSKEVRDACLKVEEYYKTTKDEQRHYVRQVLESSLGPLLTDRWDFLSDETDSRNLYDEVHNRHGRVVISVGQEEQGFQKSLCTLAKAFYQQAVLASLDASNRRTPEKGPFSVLACDEYAWVATESPSGLVSDSGFFSLSREAGCMSILAIQSLATARSRLGAGMADRWEAILGNVGLRIFMKLNDRETARLASEFAGRQKQVRKIVSLSKSSDGRSVSDSPLLFEEEVVPTEFFTNQLQFPYAYVHGTVDVKCPPVSTFVQIAELADPRT